MFALVGLFITSFVYICLSGLALHLLFPKTSRTTFAIMSAICFVLAYFGVLFNGVLPPIPLEPNAFWAFALVLYVGLSVINAFATRWTVENMEINLLQAGVCSAVLNLMLMIVFTAPLFYCSLYTSNWLLKSPAHNSSIQSP